MAKPTMLAAAPDSPDSDADEAATESEDEIATESDGETATGNRWYVYIGCWSFLMLLLLIMYR